MNYLILGGSAAGISAVEGIRELDRTGNITLVSDEAFSLYSRCLLSYYIAGSIPKEKLKFRPADFFEKNRVDALLGNTAERVVPQDRKVLLAGGKQLFYDRLLIATGARAKTVSIPGSQKRNVLTLRTVYDADRMIELSGSIKTAAILGGGLVGMKDAYALKARGLNVIVIVKSSQILSQMLDRGSAEIVKKHVEDRGIRIMLGVEAKEIVGGESVSGIVLDNGEKLDCELVVVGKGVDPCIGPVKDSDIKTHWGIPADEKLQTNLPGIYAAGDVAETTDIASGAPEMNALWPTAVEQGRIAGMNMAGGSQKYAGSLGMNSVDFYGLPIISAGITKPKEEGYEILASEDRASGKYRKVVLRNNRVVGVVLVNSVEKSGVYVSLIRKKIDISPIKDLLVKDSFDFSKIVPLIRQQQYNFQEEEYQETILTGRNAV